ncbi:MAG TPA: hypothetical protein VN578_11635 [Candidatus Binatia bacterium]|jgi:hypothetical protein|nr:hypothetical protein [Candidatus Binatia bacterium]
MADTADTLALLGAGDLLVIAATPVATKLVGAAPGRRWSWWSVC